MTDDRSAREMPPLLRELAVVPIDHGDGDGIDFEPFTDFMAADETTRWLRLWTGNDTLDGDAYLIFGQDGSGGYAAFWRTGDDVAILDRPIVFFGSEGETGVVAQNFADYLWLLADGVGPYEAVAYPQADGRPDARFTAFAVSHSGTGRKTAQQVVAAARSACPSFAAGIEAVIR